MSERREFIVDEPSADGVGRGWLAETERRYQEIKNGTASTIPSEEVFAEFAARHQQ